MRQNHDFVDSYKKFRNFYGEMRDYKVAEMRPSGVTDTDLDDIISYADYIAAFARYIKEHY